MRCSAKIRYGGWCSYGNQDMAKKNANKTDRLNALEGRLFHVEQLLLDFVPVLRRPWVVHYFAAGVPPMTPDQRIKLIAALAEEARLPKEVLETPVAPWK